jgi:AcrR family transcriptional regulator
MPTMKATTRLSKDERRREIVEAATVEFAVGGLNGTPVETIARRVGVSQPYLFQLFGTKKDLFIAAVRRAFDRTVVTFRTATADVAGDADSETILMTMGEAYHRLLQDRTLLLMQMQAYAACDDEEVRAVVREEFQRLVRFAQSVSGASALQMTQWLGYGMLMNVAAAMDLLHLDDHVKQDWMKWCLGEQFLDSQKGSEGGGD